MWKIIHLRYPYFINLEFSSKGAKPISDYSEAFVTPLARRKSKRDTHIDVIKINYSCIN